MDNLNYGLRSPSPVIPGAWPSPSLHKRSNTCPAISNAPPKQQSISASSTLPDPLHLDHVRDFHHRLSLSLAKPLDISAPAAFNASKPPNDMLQFSDLASIPSEGSGLTSFTPQNTSTTFSAFADTSIDTAYTHNSAHGEFICPKLQHFQYRPQNPDPSIPSEMDSYDMNMCLPNGLGSIAQRGLESPGLSPPFMISPTRTSLHEQHISMAPSISPILFSSRPSSENASPPSTSTHTRHRSVSLGYPKSLSLETPHRTDCDDRETLWADQHLAVAESPPLKRSSSQVGHEDQSSSIDMDIQAIPMLTALSLPGSVDTSFSALIPSVHDPSPQLVGRADKTWMPDPSLISPSTSVSPVLSQTSPSLSLSPESLLLGTTVEPRILEFPSPSLSISPFASVFPSPSLEQSGFDEIATPDTGAAEYATAVMSSVWGEANNIAIAAPGCGLEVGAREELEMPNRNGRTGGMITIIKKIGGRLKGLVQNISRRRANEAKAMAVKISAGAITLERNGRITTINCIQDSASTREPQLDQRNSQDSRMTSPLPAPPGLLLRPRRRRPSLTPQTYASSPHEIAGHNHAEPPAILPDSIDCSSERAADTSRTVDVLEHSRNDLQIEARPKTLEEIKSKRRFSLSALSQLARPPGLSSSSVVARATSRPKSTVSTVSEHANDTRDRCIPGRVAATSLDQAGGSIRREIIDRVPSSFSRPRLFSQRSADLSNNRRFSLSALPIGAKGKQTTRPE